MRNKYRKLPQYGKRNDIKIIISRKAKLVHDGESKRYKAVIFLKKKKKNVSRFLLPVLIKFILLRDGGENPLFQNCAEFNISTKR